MQHQRPDPRRPRPPRDTREDPRGPRPPRDPRDSRGGDRRHPAHHRSASGPAPLPAAVAQAGIPHGATEGGWLPDCVYTGDKFESGLAFFADTHGRITRFSREPADLAAARRLPGQAALPGLVNAHSHAFLRVLRGRVERRSAEARTAAERHALERLSGEDVFDVARMAFLEMLLGGVTCVGEFHYIHHQPDGSPWPDPTFLAREVIRAARDVGLRIALLHVSRVRSDFGPSATPAPARSLTADIDRHLRDLETLRLAVEKEFAADEAWLGAAPYSPATVPLDAFKAVATYARAQRLRLHTHLAETPAENAACVATHGRSPVALLAEHGLIDKRFTAVGASCLDDTAIQLLGSARAAVCACPSSGLVAAERLLAAGAGLALGTDAHARIDLLGEARLLDPDATSPDAATTLFRAATFGGARSLGATTGALEVGRPADFFTVNLFDPAIAGADPSSLLSHVVFALERRAIRDVWVGARQRLAAGRHVNHGPIVGRFVDAQKRLWAT